MFVSPFHSSYLPATSIHLHTPLSSPVRQRHACIPSSTCSGEEPQPHRPLPQLPNICVFVPPLPPTIPSNPTFPPKPIFSTFALSPTSPSPVPTNPLFHPLNNDPDFMPDTYYNDQTESNWVLRNRHHDRHVVQQALHRATSQKSQRKHVHLPPSDSAPPSYDQISSQHPQQQYPYQQEQQQHQQQQRQQPEQEQRQQHYHPQTVSPEVSERLKPRRPAPHPPPPSPPSSYLYSMSSHSTHHQSFHQSHHNQSFPDVFAPSHAAGPSSNYTSQPTSYASLTHQSNRPSSAQSSYAPGSYASQSPSPALVQSSRSRPTIGSVPRRSRDRSRNFRRARRPDQPISHSSNAASEVASEPVANSRPFFHNRPDHQWRIPLLRSPRRLRLLSMDENAQDDVVSDAPTPWSNPTPEPSSDNTQPNAVRPYSNSNFDRRLPPNSNHYHHLHHHHRTDRRATPSHLDFPNSSNSHPHSSHSRDRVAKRFPHGGNNGARWRGLLARKDLVDGKVDAYCTDSAAEDSYNYNNNSPRSSLDIEEAVSLYSWEADPPSTSVRGWRSNHSLSYRPKPNDRPRHIRVIGRQSCINDLTDIVDASNEPCVSYDRQIFDPVSKLWTYVEASQPSSSPWELRTVGSPVTCSVSGTEEVVSTNTTRTGRTITNTTTNSHSSNTTTINTIPISTITHSTAHSSAANTAPNTANSSRNSTLLGTSRAVHNHHIPVSSASTSAAMTTALPTPAPAPTPSPTPVPTPVPTLKPASLSHAQNVLMSTGRPPRPRSTGETAIGVEAAPSSTAAAAVTPITMTAMNSISASDLDCPTGDMSCTTTPSPPPLQPPSSSSSSSPYPLPPPPPPPRRSSGDNSLRKGLSGVSTTNTSETDSTYTDGDEVIQLELIANSEEANNVNAMATALEQRMQLLNKEQEEQRLQQQDEDEINKRRNSSPPTAVVTNEKEGRKVFMTAREQWLGYSRKSIYGPANLEAVIFASELEDAKEGALRRASMV